MLSKLKKYIECIQIAIVWILLFSSAWEHSAESEANNGEDVIFWDSLWFVHKLVYVLAYLELILKGILLYYLVVNYKEKYKFKDLFNLNYDEEKKMIQPQNINEQQNNGDNNGDNYINESNNSFASNFKNKY